MAPKTRTLSVLLVLATAAGACTSSDAPSASRDLDSGSIELTAGLEHFDSCDELLDRLITEGLERVGPYGFGQGGHPFMAAEAGTDDSGDEAMAESSSADASTGDGDRTVTDTNTQEDGVDEADLVKTDGSHLVAVGGGRILVLDVTGDSPELIHRVDLPEPQGIGELFILDDRVYVISSGWTDVAFGDAATTRFGGMPTTRIGELDLTTGRFVRTLEFEGNSLSAREIDGTIRFALSAPAGRFPFVYPSNPRAEEGAEAANRQIVASSSIEQWVPSYRILEDGEEVESGSLLDCDRLYLPEEFSGFGTVSILTIDGTTGLAPLDAAGVLSDGQTIYASTDRLTVATQRWPEWNPETGQVVPDSNFAVKLHSFDITETTAAYTGSGSAPGHLLSRYSLSEHDGYLRVATTIGDPWTGDGSSESVVTVLAERSGRLEKVGEVGGLGRSEQIFAVRFLGDVAYVVTFRQIDPLYTVDLGEPTDPSVRGELKITGFSSYLHPLPDGRLLGIGQAGDADGRILGAQASIFDVTDLDNPTKLDELLLGPDSSSSVEYDPRAFTWWSEENTFILPVSWWGWDEATSTDNSGSGAVLIEIEGDALTETGRISHQQARECEPVVRPLEDDIPAEPDADEPGAVEADAEAHLVEESASTIAPEPDGHCWSYNPEIRRAVVVGSTIYTISDAGILASDSVTLNDKAWIAFNR